MWDKATGEAGRQQAHVIDVTVCGDFYRVTIEIDHGRQRIGLIQIVMGALCQHRETQQQAQQDDQGSGDGHGRLCATPGSALGAVFEHDTVLQ